jgi:hypothetical protein
MPATTGTKAAQETWLDLQRSTLPGAPEPRHLLDRQAFLAKLDELDLDVDEGTLRSWEHHGVIPRAVRRWDPAVKARRAWYAPWVIALVVRLRELQANGLSLQELAPQLRAEATLAINHNWTADLMGEDALSRLVPIVPATLEPALVIAAKRYQRAKGTRIIRAEVKLIDENNMPVSWLYAVKIPKDPR